MMSDFLALILLLSTILKHTKCFKATFLFFKKAIETFGKILESGLSESGLDVTIYPPNNLNSKNNSDDAENIRDLQKGVSDKISKMQDIKKQIKKLFEQQNLTDIFKCV